MRKLISKIIKITSYCLFGFVICLSLFLVALRYMGETPSVFGYSCYYVLTTSMEPEIKAGEMILGKSVDPAQLQVGDVVTYMGDTGALKDKIITHKIIDINGDIIITQGVANEDPDPAIYSSQIMSRYVATLPFVGKLFSVINSKFGFIFLILTPLGLLIVNEISVIVKTVKEDKEEHLSE